MTKKYFLHPVAQLLPSIMVSVAIVAIDVYVITSPHYNQRVSDAAVLLVQAAAIGYTIYLAVRCRQIVVENGRMHVVDAFNRRTDVASEDFVEIKSCFAVHYTLQLSGKRSYYLISGYKELYEYSKMMFDSTHSKAVSYDRAVYQEIKSLLIESDKSLV